jgi:hypothetical protein
LEFLTSAFKAHGINTNREEIMQHLQIGSMKRYLKNDQCRIVSLQQAMDGGPVAAANHECMCDVCNVDDVCSTLWTRAVESVPQQTIPEISQPLDEEERAQHRSARSHLESLIDPWLRNYAASGVPCWWHRTSSPVHTGLLAAGKNNTDILQWNDCRRPLLTFLGHENDRSWFCFECGDVCLQN